MKILILSRNPALYSTRSLYMAARKRNHEVRVVDHMRCELVMQRDALEIYFENEKLEQVDAIIPRIGASATSYGAAVIRHFELMGVFTALRSEALLRSRDKRTSLQFLAAKGIKVPKTVVTNNLNAIQLAIDEVGPPPVVIKLLSSTHGYGVILGETESSAASIMEAFLGLGEKVILQEFISEARGADIRVFVVGGKVVASMERIAQPGEFRSNLHRGGTSRKIYLTAQEREVAIKAAQILQLKVAGVDIVRSNDGPLVLEVNASPGLEGIEGTTGVDIAGKIIQLVEKSANRFLHGKTVTR